jgi:hypothetical protein
MACDGNHRTDTLADNSLIGEGRSSPRVVERGHAFAADRTYESLITASAQLHAAFMMTVLAFVAIPFWIEIGVKNMRKTNVFAATMIFALAGLGTANADLPGKHPFYLHALSDLRGARWMLEHRPGDTNVSSHEDLAVQQIDAAIGELKKAAIDDGKDIHDHPGVDVPADHPGRLHKAAELLRKVHGDVDREEDDPAARGLKHRAVEHIDQALHQTEAAISDVEHHR